MIIIFFSSLGFSRWFSTSWGKTLGLKNASAKDISHVFIANKNDIYTTALDFVKSQEVKKMFSAIDAIMKIHPEFSSCNVKADDIINILYDSHQNFRTLFHLTVLNKAGKSVSLPSERDIKKSYKDLLLCRQLQADFVTLSDSQAVRNVLKEEYNIAFYANNYNSTSLISSHFGDDIYQNGSLEDSDYDLLVDINEIGKLFFQSFTKAPETLFYQYPDFNQKNGNNDSTTVSGSDIVTLLPSGISTGINGQVGTNLLGMGNSNKDILINSSTEDSLLFTADPALNNFINSNTTQVFAPNDLYALPSNPCISGISLNENSSNSLFSQYTTSEYKDYIQQLIDNLDKNTETDFFGSSLISLNMQSIPGLNVSQGGGVSQSNSNGSLSSNSFAVNQLVEQFVDNFTGACFQNCESLSDGEKLVCQNDCFTKCLEKCNDIQSLDDKLICNAMCTCFSVGGPFGENWRGMENMYKIKFCTVPVEQHRIQKGQKVSSIQEIFLTIKNIFESLLYGGEIFKRTKTTEYFDSSLADLKFKDIFSFQVLTQFKPLFSNFSKDSQKKHLQQNNDTYQSTILNMSPDWNNKYVVIADVASSKAWSEPINDLKDYQKKVDDLKSIESQNISSSERILQVSTDDAFVNLNKEIQNFLYDNIQFWQITSQTLQEINNLAQLLKYSIETKG